jgi:hypothetical protein
MTDQDPKAIPVVPAAAPVPAPPPAVFQSVDEVVAGAMSRLPELAACQSELGLLATMWVRFINPPAGGQAPKEKAQRLLDTLMGKSFQDVTTAVKMVNRTLTQARIELAIEYGELTGTEIRPEELDLGSRYQEERGEHDQLAGQNNQALANVARLAAFYGFPNPDPALETDEPIEKETLGQTLTRKVIERLNDTPAEAVEEVKGPEPGWLTPPVFDGDDPVIERFVVVVEESTGNAQTALSGLEAFGIDLAEIQEMAAYVAQKARAQQELTANIMANVGVDQREFANRVRVLLDVGQIVGANANYIEM